MVAIVEEKDVRLKLSDLESGDRPGEYRYPILLAGDAPANTHDRQRAMSDRLRSIEALLCEGEIYAVFRPDGTLYTVEATEGRAGFAGYQYFAAERVTKKGVDGTQRVDWHPVQDNTLFDSVIIPDDCKIVKVVPWIIDAMEDDIADLDNAYSQLKQGLMKLFTPGTGHHDCFKPSSAFTDAQTNGEAMDGCRYVVVNDGSYSSFRDLLYHFNGQRTMTQHPTDIALFIDDGRRLTGVQKIVDAMFAPAIDVSKTVSHPKFTMDKDELLAVIDRDAPRSERVITLFGSASIAAEWALQMSLELTMEAVEQGGMSTVHGGGIVGYMATNNFGTLAAGGHSMGVNTPPIVAMEGKPISSYF